MKAEDSKSAVKDAEQSRGDNKKSPNDEASSAPPTSQTAAAKKHQVTEVPKFRFVSMAKKSAGYSSAAAGRYIEGKTAAELASKYQAPADIVSSNDASNKNAAVGKLNMTEREEAMRLQIEKKDTAKTAVVERDVVVEKVEEEESTIIVEAPTSVKERKQEEEEDLEQEISLEKKGKVEMEKVLEEEDKEEGDNVKDREIQEEVKVSSVQRVEEKDLEAGLPAEPQREIAAQGVDPKQCSYDDMGREGVLYSSDSAKVVAVVVPTDRSVERSKEDTDTIAARRRRRNKILCSILVVLLTAVGVLSAIFVTSPTPKTNENLTEDNFTNEDDTEVIVTEAPSETLATWDMSSRFPRPPAETPVPTPNLSPTSCVGSLPDGTCNEMAIFRQQLTVPQGGTNPANIHFGHSVTFINDNIVAAATDGSESGAGVHIYFKQSSELYSHFQSIYEGDEQHLFGYSLAASKNTNTLVVGAPARDGNEEIKCVRVWCGTCPWSVEDATPCADRLAVISSGLNSDSEETMQEIMSSGRCIAEEICNEVTKGEVYVYEPTGNTWVRVAVIVSDDPSFGSVIAMDGGMIAIGSPDQDKVSIYERSGNEWILMETKTSQTKGTRFGSSLSLSDGVLAVGSPLDGIGGITYVYAMSANGFALLGQPLQAISPGENFGQFVSVSGCTVAVSSSKAVTSTTTFTDAVRIFTYDRDSSGGYSAVQIVEPIEEVTRNFPECLAMEGNNLIIGRSQGGSSRRGIITHFVRRNDEWALQSVIDNPLPDGGTIAGAFGCGLSISENSVLIGAKGIKLVRPGIVYVADLCPEDELV